jgi:hypothetical protein
MATVSVPYSGARTTGPTGADDPFALRAGSLLHALTIFAGLRVSPRGDYGADLSSGRPDAALPYCCLLADDALYKPAMFATVTRNALGATVAALLEWAGASGALSPDIPAAAIAFLEAFKQSGTCLQHDRVAFAPSIPTLLDTLAQGVQFKAVRATLKTFSSATLAAWCPGGDTTLLALALQAIRGPLQTGGARWTPDARAQTVAVLQSLRRRAGSHASACEALATVHDVLRGRALLLHVTYCPMQFKRLVAPLPGDLFDPPIPAYLDLALTCLPLLHLAVHERPDPSVSIEDAVLNLLRCYDYQTDSASITQGNLMLLEGKTKTMLAGRPSKAGASAFGRDKGLIAAQASTSGPDSGETRARYDVVAWEGILQSLSGASGKNAADILTVLTSKYLAFRSALVRKAPSASHPLISRITALASKWASYLAKRIAGADMCAVSAYHRALLTDLLAR